MDTKDTFYHYMVGHSHDVRFVMSLNGVPFYRREPGEFPISRTGYANHLLRPGTNVFEAEIEHAAFGSVVSFALLPELGRGRAIYDFTWPAVWRRLPSYAKRLPYGHTGSFELTGLTKEPVYLAAPPAPFGVEEQAGVRVAVRRFHSAIRRRDAEAVADEGRLKIGEFRRFYPDMEDATEGATVRSFGELFKRDPLLRPLDEKRMQIRSCADGRAAYVTGPWGASAIEASADGKTVMARDLWFTRQGKRWQLFR